jgi:SAM-dependent methyltransferase
MPQIVPCIVCGGETSSLAKLPPLPTASNRWASSKAEAREAPRGILDLVSCGSCGHVFNRAFEPRLVPYDEGYDTALHFSAHYRSYAAATVARLTRSHHLYGRRIVEIGCGDGEFLDLLCAEWGNDGCGYDPGRPGMPRQARGAGFVEIVGREAAAADIAGADFVCCRQVLEHIPEPMALLGRVRQALRPGAAVFFEVPNGLFTFAGLGVWDLIYEHVSYFTPRSLRYAFAQAGFVPLRTRSAFGGQYLWIEATARRRWVAAPPQRSPASSRPEIPPSFAEHLATVIEEWGAHVASLLRGGARIVVWGAGSKGATFLNLLAPRIGHGIEWVVDISPRKQGRFVPGTGQRIVSPAELQIRKPDCVLVMNPEYAPEVAERLSALELDSRLILVSGARPPKTPRSRRAAARARRPASAEARDG